MKRNEKNLKPIIFCNKCGYKVIKKISSSSGKFYKCNCNLFFDWSKKVSPEGWVTLELSDKQQKHFDRVLRKKVQGSLKILKRLQQEVLK